MGAEVDIFLSRGLVPLVAIFAGERGDPAPYGVVKRERARLGDKEEGEGRERRKRRAMKYMKILSKPKGWSIPIQNPYCTNPPSFHSMVGLGALAFFPTKTAWGSRRLQGSSTPPHLKNAIFVPLCLIRFEHRLSLSQLCDNSTNYDPTEYDLWKSICLDRKLMWLAGSCRNATGYRHVALWMLHGRSVHTPPLPTYSTLNVTCI